MNRYALMCPDLKAAAENRERIKNKYATEFWRRVEHAIRGTHKNQPLPSWVPVSNSIFSVHKYQGHEDLTVGRASWYNELSEVEDKLEEATEEAT